MNVLGVRVPVEFYQIPHNFTIKQLYFFSLRNDLHQNVCARRSINMPILLVIEVYQVAIFCYLSVIVYLVEGAWQQV